MKHRCPLSGAAWCPLCYEALRCRKAHKGHLNCTALTPRCHRRRKWFMLRKRRSSDGEAAQGSPSSCSLTVTFPTLAEFLSQQVWEDGSPRQTGTLMLFVEEGRWKGWLHDRDGCCSSFLSNSTLSNLLGSLNTALEGDEMEWRPDRPKPSGRAGK